MDQGREEEREGRGGREERRTGDGGGISGIGGKSSGYPHEKNMVEFDI